MRLTLALALVASPVAAAEPLVVRGLEHCLAAVESFELPPFEDWVIAQPYVSGELMPGVVQGAARHVRADQQAALVLSTSLGLPDNISAENPEGRFASCEMMVFQLDTADTDATSAALDIWISAGKAQGDLIDALPRAYGAPPPETQRHVVSCNLLTQPVSLLFDIQDPLPGAGYPLDKPHWTLRIASPNRAARAACSEE